MVSLEDVFHKGLRVSDLRSEEPVSSPTRLPVGPAPEMPGLHAEVVGCTAS